VAATRCVRIFTKSWMSVPVMGSVRRVFWYSPDLMWTPTRPVSKSSKRTPSSRESLRVYPVRSANDPSVFRRPGMEKIAAVRTVPDEAAETRRN